MSTAYRFQPPVQESEFLKEAAMMGFEPDRAHPEAKPDCYGVTDGVDCNYAWVYVNGDGTVSFERFGMGNADFMYDIADALGVTCLSEHDEGFFEDEEDEDAEFFKDEEDEEDEQPEGYHDGSTQT